jgi:hypothetical protein
MKPYTLETTTHLTKRGQVLRYHAVIKPCAKRGIKVRRQKTVKLRTVAPEFTRQEMALSIERELDRWAEKKLKVQPPLG